MRRSGTTHRSIGLGSAVLAALLLGACSGGPGTTTAPSVASDTTPPSASRMRPTSGSDMTTDDTPSRGGPSPTSTGPGCAGRATSPGPAGSLVVVALTAPPTATAGGVVTVSAVLVVISSGPRVVLTGRGSAVEILRGSTVVGRAPGPAVADVPLPLTAGASYPGQTLPTQVPLVGCDGGPLPPGAYRLRAVVAYGGDPLNAAPGGGSGSFVLVSDPPNDLTVT